MKPVARDSQLFAPRFAPDARAASVAAAAPLRVALTFDDSLKDHLLVAAPMLEERGWRGTFCIVTDWIGRDDSRLSWDDVRELVRRGHEIATHTASHRDLLTLLERILSSADDSGVLVRGIR